MMENDTELGERVCFMSVTTSFQLDEQMKDQSIETLIGWKKKHAVRPAFEEGIDYGCNGFD